MSVYDFVHLGLYALGGEIKGRTKFQKTIYFLGILTDSLEELGYRPHFYGPFSAEVAGALDRLRALGFVDQSIVSRGSVDDSGFEVARHDFRLTEEGKKIAEAKAKQNPQVWNRLQGAVEILNRAKEQDYMRLSIAAKTYFMLGEKKGKASSDDLASLASKFGWSVTREQVQDAGRFLESLGLITPTAR